MKKIVLYVTIVIVIIIVTVCSSYYVIAKRHQQKVEAPYEIKLENIHGEYNDGNE